MKFETKQHLGSLETGSEANYWLTSVRDLRRERKRTEPHHLNGTEHLKPKKLTFLKRFIIS